MKRPLFPIVLALSILLAGCSAGTAADTTAASQSAAATASATAAASAAEVTAQTTAAATTATTSAAADLVLPLTGNTSGKVQIQTVSANPSYKYTSYIITSIEGESVVVDPTMMPDRKIVDVSPAAIISTHSHDDHICKVFTDSYDCQKILYEPGDITTRDFHIYTVASSHANDTILAKPSNFIVVFEVDGLRIAHMGDIGQTVLTDEQLEAIGPIDIAFMQFENSYSDMSLKNEKGFSLIEQLNPKIIVPTHYTDDAIPVLTEKYGAVTDLENVMTISKEDLPQDTLQVYHITNTHKYK